MKNLLIVLMALALNACYVAPYGDGGDGYRRDRERHEDHDRGGRDGGRDGGRNGDRGDRDR